LIPSPIFTAFLLFRAATATSLALVAAATVGAVVVWRTARSFAPLLTIARTLVAMAVAITIGWHLPWMGRPMVVVQAALVAAVYLAVAIGTREIGPADWALVTTTFGKRRAASPPKS
jgi:hypothetical protein